MSRRKPEGDGLNPAENARSFQTVPLPEGALARRGPPWVFLPLGGCRRHRARKFAQNHPRPKRCVPRPDARALRRRQAGLANRVQITSDGHKTYLEAIEETFGCDVDYAQLVKIYGQPTDGPHRYSPPECIGCATHKVERRPDPKHVSTSFVERQNLNIRMGNRRMTRLTNAFSKKAANHQHMMAIYFMHYNFARIHQTLKITPGMAANVTPKLWEMSDMVALLAAWEADHESRTRGAR